MRIVECEQGTAQWLTERVGRITASRVTEALSKFKAKNKDGEETAERRNYKVDVIVERLTGRSTENFMSPEMVWGSENEPYARAAYDQQFDVMTEKVGFILHPRFDWSGASPDALAGDDGGVEIKAPKTATHLKWMMAGVVPEEHQDQCLWNMACAERSWWDFVSFDPRLPDGLNLFTVRMPRDDIRIHAMEYEIAKFHGEVEEVIASLKSRIKIAPPKPDGPSEYDKWMAMIHPGLMDEVVP